MPEGFELCRQVVEGDLVGHERLRVERLGVEGAQRPLEIGERVVEDEANRQLLGERAERPERVLAHAHADDGHAGQRPGDIGGVLYQAGDADALEHHRRRLPHGRLERGAHIGGRRIDGGGGAYRLGELAPVGDRIAQHERRPEVLQPQTDRLTDRAATEHERRHAGFGQGAVDSVKRDRQRFDERASSYLDRARQPERLPGPDENLLGEAARALQADKLTRRALRRRAREARRAPAAADERQRTHVLAFTDTIDAGTDGEHLATQLVTQHDAGDAKLRQVQVGAADPAGHHPDQDLAGAGLRGFALLEHQRFPRTLGHGDTHRRTVPRRHGAAAGNRAGAPVVGLAVHNPPKTLFALGLAAVLVLTACGGGDEVDTGSGNPDGAGPPSGDPGELAIEITSVGGFTTPDFQFGTLPSVTVYGDGTSITQGATIAIFPGPAVSPLTQGSIDAETLGALLDQAVAAGLANDVPPNTGDMGSLGIADATSTRITITIDGEQHVTEVYALLEAEGIPSPNMPAGVADIRSRMADFVRSVTDAATAAEQGSFTPDRFRVLATADDGSSADPGLEPNRLEWPAAAPPLVEGTCVEVAGEAAAAVSGLLAQATQITLWNSGGTTFRLVLRPVLPHEPGCP